MRPNPPNNPASKHVPAVLDAGAPRRTPGSFDHPTLNRCLREPSSAPAAYPPRSPPRSARGSIPDEAPVSLSPPEPRRRPSSSCAALRGEHLRGRRVEHDGGLVVVLPARGTLRHLVVLRRQLHHCEENGDANGEISSRTSRGRTRVLRARPLGKKAGSRLAGAGSRRRAGGAGTHAGASTRRSLQFAFARTKMFVRRVERVAAERAILARVVVVLVGRHRLAVCTSSPSKNCSLAHAGALCPPATAASSRALLSRGFSHPESAALHAPRGRHRGLPSSPKTDERDDARLKERTRLTRRARDWPTFRDRSRRKICRAPRAAGGDEVRIRTVEARLRG